MRKAVVIKNGEDHCDRDAVIAAQRRSLRVYPVAVHRGSYGVRLEIEVQLRLLFADHVMMTLQNEYIGVFVPRAGGLSDYHVVGAVTKVLKAVLPCKFDKIIRNCVRVPRAVRDGAYFLKIAENVLRLIAC